MSEGIILNDGGNINIELFDMRFNYPRITYRQAMAIGYITRLLTLIERSNAELYLAKFFVDLVFRCIS